MPSDIDYLNQALTLAKRGQGFSLPNPMVGAVIVKNGQVIAKGYHKRAGEAHAEAAAISSAKSSLKGATLYVNLEPCNHFGKTPPCVEAIIKSGIARVVCSILDPNPLVAGKGLRALKQAGLDVSVGQQAEPARRLNEAHFTFYEQARPFISLKFAASLDGKLATKQHDSKWLTNEAARAYARRLRSRYQAILIGANTALYDDPHLGSRRPSLYDPIRVILDAKLKIPLNAKVLRDSRVIVVCSQAAAKSKIAKIEARGCRVLTFKGVRIKLSDLLADLAKEEIVSVLVEGGGEVLGEFIDEQLIDKVYCFYAPLIIGGQTAVTIGGKGNDKVSSALRLSQLSFKRFGDNQLISGYLRK